MPILVDWNYSEIEGSIHGVNCFKIDVVDIFVFNKGFCDNVFIWCKEGVSSNVLKVEVQKARHFIYIFCCRVAHIRHNLLQWHPFLIFDDSFIDELAVIVQNYLNFSQFLWNCHQSEKLSINDRFIYLCVKGVAGLIFIWYLNELI